MGESGTQELLENVIQAHGGLDRWQQLREFRARVRLRTPILRLRGRWLPELEMEVRAGTDACRVELTPFLRPERTGLFSPDGLRLGSDQLSLAEARQATRSWQWSDAAILYFLGYALWNYAQAPFYFARPDMDVTRLEPVSCRGEMWDRLQVRYPETLPTHCREQTYYFDSRGWLRRLDYTADIFGRVARAAHYCAGHRQVDGIIVPTHRYVLWRPLGWRPLPWGRVMEGWLDDVELR